MGYVEYPVVGLVSGLAPLSTLNSNSTTLLNSCIVSGTGPAAPNFSGQLVRPPGLLWRLHACTSRGLLSCGHVQAVGQGSQPL